MIFRSLLWTLHMGDSTDHLCYLQALYVEICFALGGDMTRFWIP